MKKEFAKWMGLMLIICQLTIPAYAGTSFTDVPDAAPYAEAVTLMYPIPLRMRKRQT